MGNVMGRTTRGVHAAKQVRGLEMIEPEHRAMIYKLRYRYAGYKLTDPLEIKGSTLQGKIDYLEKTEDATGLGGMFSQLKSDASAEGCTAIKVEFDQCSPKMQRKLEKHAKEHGFDCDEVPVFEPGEAFPKAVGPTGPNIQVYKNLKE